MMERQKIHIPSFTSQIGWNKIEGKTVVWDGAYLVKFARSLPLSNILPRLQLLFRLLYVD
jgi:hypothetical protein